MVIISGLVWFAIYQLDGVNDVDVSLHLKIANNPTTSACHNLQLVTKTDRRAMNTVPLQYPEQKNAIGGLQ